jgi:hypothetical protein
VEEFDAKVPNLTDYSYEQRSVPILVRKQQLERVRINLAGYLDCTKLPYRDTVLSLDAQLMLADLEIQVDFMQQQLLRLDSKDKCDKGHCSDDKKGIGGQASESLPAKQRLPKMKPPCCYCGEKDHWADNCFTYKTQKERFEQLLRERRCIRCTRIHDRKDGTCHNYTCRCCNAKGSHHRSLCPNLWNRKSSNAQ